MSQSEKTTMKRREMLKRGIVGAAGLAGSVFLAQNATRTYAQPTNRPNIIIFHADDQDYDSLGCYGNDVLTPNADGLADAGIRFDRAYTPTGVCTASRYALVTGQYPSRCRTESFLKRFPKGVMTEPSFNTHLAPGQDCIASILKTAGYETGFVGKWDLGGFDGDRMQQYPRTKHWGGSWRELDDNADPSDPAVSAVLEHNHAVMSECVKRFGFDYAEAVHNNPESWGNRLMNYHNPEWVTQAAVDFIDRKRDKPFFLYLNHTLHHIPHPQESLLIGDPRMTLGGYLDRVPDIMPSRREIFEHVVREGFRPETAWCTWMDIALGVVLKRLAEHGISDNTLIIYFSDNNVPAKCTIYEDGVRVPMMLRYPALVKGGRHSKRLVQNIDFAPTVFDLAGAKVPADMTIDGKSMKPLMIEEDGKIHDELFFEIGWTRACCTERWKYLAVRYPKNMQDDKPKWHSNVLTNHQHHALLWHPAFHYPDQLYDLDIDPHEVVNYSTQPEYSNVLEDMKGRTKRWLRTFDNPFGEFTG